MLGGIGPGLLRRPRRHCRHHRRRRPAHRAAARRARLRASSPQDPDPRGLPVIGADGAVAGTVSDMWVDRAEVLFRYLEVEVRWRGGRRRVLLPINFSRIGRQRGPGALDPGGAVRRRARHAQPRRRHLARRGQDHGLLRRRHACTPRRRARSRCCDRRTTRRPSTSSRPRPACPRRCRAGERMLWQGAPDWRVLARDALHMRGSSPSISACCWSGAAPACWPTAAAWLDAAWSMLWLLPLAAAGARRCWRAGLADRPHHASTRSPTGAS